jgi:hypothetical protein
MVNFLAKHRWIILMLLVIDITALFASLLHQGAVQFGFLDPMDTMGEAIRILWMLFCALFIPVHVFFGAGIWGLITGAL